MPDYAASTVVVGGGIAGLAAAWFLAEAGEDVLVLEGSPAVGGKLRLASVAGVEVDVGAEAMLNRRPEGVALARAAGLDPVQPATTRSQLWSCGMLRPLPRTLLGVPLDLDDLAASGVLSADGLDAVRHPVDLPAPAGDEAVGALVGARLGEEVVDRLLEPLLGGVYAGHARALSAAAATPQLMALLQRGGSLLEAAATLPVSDTPVFAGLEGGLGRLPQALAGSGRFAVRTDAVVREVSRAAGGFRLAIGSTREPSVVEAGRLVLATPAAPTARLLADLAPRAGATLARIESASMAIVTLAVTELDAAGSSGFLVPPDEGRRIKAATYSSSKWDWVRDASSYRILRASLGRHREEAVLEVTDDELVAAAVADLADATGRPLDVVDRHVQRWGGALPQYAVGHLDRVAAIRADVARVPGLAVCGAAYDGVGIPAVIASAQRAAAAVLRAQ
ncbi:MAG: protoporphyrinogen oxidase [Nocardioides sp.]